MTSLRAIGVNQSSRLRFNNIDEEFGVGNSSGNHSLCKGKDANADYDPELYQLCSRREKEYKVITDYLMYVAIGQLCFGLINIILIAIVFFQRKYNRRPMFVLLRCFFLTNGLVLIYGAILFSVTRDRDAVGLSQHKIKLFLAFPWGMSVMASDGLLAILSIGRYFFCKFPLQVRGPSYQVKKIAISALVINFFLAFGAALPYIITDDYNLHRLIMAWHNVFMLMLIIIFNAATVVLQTKTESSLSSGSSAVSKRLKRYAVLLSVLCILTSTPYTTMELLFLKPAREKMKNSQSANECHKHCAKYYHYATISEYCLWAKLCNSAFDNVLFYISSSEYRAELHTVLKKIVNKARRGNAFQPPPASTFSGDTTLNRYPI